MPLLTLPLETWRAVIDALRAEGLPAYMDEHAVVMERRLDEHGPDAPAVALDLSDDVYLRSYNWARPKLGIPLSPPEHRATARWRGARAATPAGVP